MNSSANRIVVAVLVLVVGGLAVYFTGDRVLWQPYKKLKTRLTLVQTDYEDKERAFRDFKLAQANFAKYNKMSLPNDFDVAVSKYHRILNDILQDSGLVELSLNDPPQIVMNTANQKKPRHIILPFDVRAKGTADAVLKSLEALQKLSLMHRVNQLDLDRAESVTLDKEPTGRLNVHMKIEAMIIWGVNNPFKLEDIQREKKRDSDRDYAMIKDRNPFLGAKFDKVIKERPDTFVGPNVPLYVVLNAISTSPVADNGEKEAFLSNRIYDTKFIRLRTAPGFDTFKIFADKDFARPMHRCKVLKIDDREIYYQLGEDVYKMTIYQTLAQSMDHKPLDAKELDELGLTEKVDAEFSKIVEAEAKRPVGGGPRVGANPKVGADSTKGPFAAKGQQGKGPQNPKGQPKQQQKQKKDRAG